MFINYNLFKHGQVVSSASRKKYSMGCIQVSESSDKNINKHKNKKERKKDS
jgi:hypothetical protein